MEVQNKKQAAQIAVLSDVEKQLEQTVAAGKKLEKQNTVL